MKKHFFVLLMFYVCLFFMSCFNGISTPNNNNEEITIKSASLGNESSLILETDGSLWVFGMNGDGQLGLSSTIIKQPTPIKLMDGVKYLSASDRYSMIIKEDDSLWATGDNTGGRFGNGNQVSSYGFIKIRDDVKSVSCGPSHTSIITMEGDLLSS
ncbi:MAG: hypothetical protein EOL97_04225 [Spirochaetia bacterium]|nr:hypothetical protein [Spirochaetia bacterium]